MTLYCFENARGVEQLEEMRRLDEAGICLFCPDSMKEQMKEHGGQEILWEDAHWIVTPNKFPYKGAELHLLLVPKEHVTDMLDLSAHAQTGFWAVLERVRREFSLTNYGLGIRNGDCLYTGGTIRHMHAHVLQGQGSTASGEFVPLRMRFSSMPNRSNPVPMPAS